MEGNGQSFEMSKVLTSPIGQDQKSRWRLVGLPYENAREPKNWITTFVAMNLVIFFAVVYHGWDGWMNSQSVLQESASMIASQSQARAVVPDSVTTHTTRVAPVRSCSGNGFLQMNYDTELEACQCHACFTGDTCATQDSSCVIDVYQGDPTMFEKFWFEHGHTCEVHTLGWQRMSYYANSKQFFFVQTELDQAIRNLHRVVKNAVTEGRHIVIGVGSTQLFQAALYALSSPTSNTPAKVVSLAPYYSSYPAVTDYVKSSMYRWAGDAAEYAQRWEAGDEYIELVTSPNNPTGEVRSPVMDRNGSVVYDLAYYWPHYTPITAPADDNILLFTLSKSTGHAGSRVGWAIVKDLKVARKMAKLIELNTIGVSKDSQIRATRILRAVAKAYEERNARPSSAIILKAEAENSLDELLPLLFHFGRSEMTYRWERLRSVIHSGIFFSIPEFQPAFCKFFGQMNAPTPAFAWIRCNDEDDCEHFLRRNGVLTRGGAFFGAETKYVRLSMLDRRPTFEILMDRLQDIQRRNQGSTAAAY